MILEYHRPTNLEQVYNLLKKTSPRMSLLGGGTRLGQIEEDVGIIDLQELGLNRIETDGSNLEIGATVTLQRLYQESKVAQGLKHALQIEAGQNKRNQATIAGEIVACDGRSPFVTALLALNARLVWAFGEPETTLGEYLALRDTWKDRQLIVKIVVPINGDLSLECVGRSPLDRPIVCVAVARWPMGRTRVALGGYGKAPLLAMDGPEPTGAPQAAENGYLHASDHWASAEYRSTTAANLVRRILGTNTGVGE